MAGEAVVTECEVDGCVTSSAVRRRRGRRGRGRKRGELYSVCFLFFFKFCPGPHCAVGLHPQLGWVFPPQLAQSRNSLTAQRIVPRVVLDGVKLTISLNQHKPRQSLALVGSLIPMCELVIGRASLNCSYISRRFFSWQNLACSGLLGTSCIPNNVFP